MICICHQASDNVSRRPSLRKVHQKIKLSFFRRAPAGKSPLADAHESPSARGAQRPKKILDVSEVARSREKWSSQNGQKVGEKSDFEAVRNPSNFEATTFYFELTA